MILKLLVVFRLFINSCCVTGFIRD